VSRETGFAIEISERYLDAVGDRWPAASGPQPDELLWSWLHRLAIANGIAPRAFACVLGLGGGMWSPRLDVRLPHELAAWLGVRTGVGSEAISAMAMTDGTLAPLLLPLRETARRNRLTGSNIALCALPRIALPIFGDRGDWRRGFPASGMAAACDRCPACCGAIAPFAQTDLIPHYVCVRCGFDLRDAAKRSVEAAERRLERSIDDICKAEIAKGSPTIHEWVAGLLRVPVVVGVGSGRPHANLPASARIRCFDLLARRAGDRLVAAAGETVAR